MTTTQKKNNNKKQQQQQQKNGNVHLAITNSKCDNISLGEECEADLLGTLSPQAMLSGT